MSRRYNEFYFAPKFEPVIGKNRRVYDLFGNSSPAPDYTPTAQASEKAAQLGYDLGQKQLDQAQAQYENNMAVSKPVVDAQVKSMNQSTAQGNDYYNYMKQYSRPVEESLYNDAMGFTPDEIKQIQDSRAQEAAAGGTSPDGSQATPKTDALTEQLAAQAGIRQKAADAASEQKITDLNSNLSSAIGSSNTDVYNKNKAAIDAETDLATADARNGFTNSQNMAIRQGLRYGMSPDAIAGAVTNNATDEATKVAAATNGTRTNATNTMYGRGVGAATQDLQGGVTDRNNAIQDKAIDTANKQNVAGLYRNLTGASQGSYGLATSAGNSAVNNQLAPGAQLMAGTNAGAATQMQGAQTNLQGLTSILNNQSSNYNANINSNNGIMSGLGSVVGSVAGAASTPWWMSDENVKKDIKPVNEDNVLQAMKGLDIKRWKYDPSKIQDGVDDKEHTGAMAQDLKKLGHNVSDGHTVDVISAMGITMAGIKALANKVDKLEKRIS